MSVAKIRKGSNLEFINVEQDYLFRGTSFNEFKKQCEKNNGLYCGGSDKYYGMGTFVAMNIDGVVSYCHPKFEFIDGLKEVIEVTNNNFKYMDKSGNIHWYGDRPLLLAIRYEPYEIILPQDEGWVISGLISLEDILLVTSKEILSKVYPNFHNYDQEKQKRVKLGLGILD